jgi:alpha-D-ribose 1-methylphosphonate 5-triphosphate diphosphatase
MTQHILTDATVVMPDRTCEAAVVIEDDRIAEILPGRRFADGFSLAGTLLVPGLVDIHTDYLEREARPPRNGVPRMNSVDFSLEMSFHFMDTRAIAAGVTTVLGSARISDSRESARWKYGDGLRLARSYPELSLHALARHFVHVRWDPTFEPADEAVAQLECIECIGNLVYNDATPGTRNQNIEDQIQAYVFHRQVSVEQARAHFAELIEKSRMVNNRAAIRDAFEGRIPIGSHDDSSADEVIEAHAYGATLAEMPVTMDAARQAKALDMMVCMGAPNYVWGRSHCGNLSSIAAMEMGLLDIFCSDFHFPAMLAAAVTMIKRGMSPSDVFRLLSLNPARHLRLDHEIGSIEVGRKADLVAFVPMKDFGRVTHVWVDGALCSEIANERPPRPPIQAISVHATL